MVDYLINIRNDNIYILYKVNNILIQINMLLFNDK